MPGHGRRHGDGLPGDGRRHAGRVGGSGGSTVGFDVYKLRTAEHPWFASGLKLTTTDRTDLVACTQQHHSMEEREPARIATLDHFRRHPKFVLEQTESERLEKTGGTEQPASFLHHADQEPAEQRWGMAIDLTSCIGCNACVVACQAENNIPVVGKEQVAAGREMHWLRVDRYISGTADAPDDVPLPAAAVHALRERAVRVRVPGRSHGAQPEGLNDMIYNRCVGTRFCSNNCPYKVRRFNFLFYADFRHRKPATAIQPRRDGALAGRDGEVHATACSGFATREIDAQAEDRTIVDGEVLTACQAACPTQAIVFGDMNDQASEVSKLKAVAAQLLAAGRPQHDSAHDLPGRTCATRTRELENVLTWPRARHVLIEPPLPSRRRASPSTCRRGTTWRA